MTLTLEVNILQVRLYWVTLRHRALAPRSRLPPANKTVQERSSAPINKEMDWLTDTMTLPGNGLQSLEAASKGNSVLLLSFYWNVVFVPPVFLWICGNSTDNTVIQTICCNCQPASSRVTQQQMLRFRLTLRLNQVCLAPCFRWLCAPQESTVCSWMQRFRSPSVSDTESSFQSTFVIFVQPLLQSDVK